jgi:DnaJ-class molecular chaperone
MEKAARALGLTWKDLRIDANALSTIVHAYRREAMIVHPDRPLGNKVQFQLVQGAREILEEYFRGDKKKVNELLMIKQD